MDQDTILREDIYEERAEFGARYRERELRRSGEGSPRGVSASLASREDGASLRRRAGSPAITREEIEKLDRESRDKKSRNEWPENEHSGDETRRRGSKSPHAVVAGHSSKGVKLDKDKQKTNDEIQPDLRKDLGSILLLLVLYTLQGIPMGLSGSIPFLLQEKVGYKEQAIFSLVTWPFSLKLLWAPLVDSVYSKSFGRRKSWLVPVQLLCAGIMIFVSTFVEDLLGTTKEPLDVKSGTASPLPSSAPQVTTLTVIFFILYFMMATQDIAVDGWALTMLSKENVAYASTCNSVGQTLGYFVAYVGFLAFNDPKICNRLLRSVPSDKPMITLSQFMNFWGWVFLLTTLFVWFFKRETEPTAENGDDDTGEEEEDLGVFQTYALLWKVVKLRSVQLLCLVMVTYQIGFSAADSITSLKLVEYGVPKEELALMAPLLIPVGIVLPVILGRWVTGPRPLDLFLAGYVPRLLVGLLYAFMVWFTPYGVVDGKIPISFYLFILFSAILHEVTSTFQFISKMAYFARVSDPAIGGTYMTLLNTISNLGTKWPNSVSLFLIESLTQKECVGEKGRPLVSIEKDFMTCHNPQSASGCIGAGGTCLTHVDGYFVEIGCCTVLGIIWIVFMRNIVRKVQDFPMSSWQVGSAAESILLHQDKKM